MATRTVKAPAASVVIVTYDAPGDLLERCVRSVVATTVGHRLVVVDNGGVAAKRLRAAGLDQSVELLDPGTNAGFAAGVNLGCRSAIDEGDDLVVVLNDDVEVHDGWLRPLLDAFTDDRVGAAQPLLVRRDDPDVIESAGVNVDRFGAGSDIGRGEPSDSVGTDVAEIPAATGGAMAIRVDALQEVGPLDERFFLYYEDLEWSRRLTSHGWRCVLVPNSVVSHQGSASTFRLGPGLLRLQERNRLWWAASSLPLPTLLSALSLSVRRLRHEPRAVHARALADGIRGALPRTARRLLGRTDRQPRTWDEIGARLPAVRAGERTTAPAFLRRPLDGVNVAGFHHVDNGLGDAVRQLTTSLRAAGIDVVEVDNDLTDAPRRFPARAVPSTLHDTTLAVVTAVETPRFREQYPELFEDGRRVVGYWFWELSELPESHRHAFDLVDDVWTPTTFVHDAVSAAADARTRVLHAPLRLPSPVADPAAVAGWRGRFGDATTFLVSFDYFSIPERKNPEAAIRAFTDAFDGRDDVLLVVKSQNASYRPAYAESVRRLAGDDDRILFVDDHLGEREHLGLIAAVDCYVSPHRSEGLGLQPAQAMALGTPSIVTAYGGVVDYCTSENSVLVPFETVGVQDGEGIYPVGTEWADIDHGSLVVAFRRVADDPALRRRLAGAGRRTVAEQRDAGAFGRAYTSLLTTLDLRRGSLWTADEGEPR